MGDYSRFQWFRSSLDGIKNIGGQWLDILYPPSCLICQTGQLRTICQDCYNQIIEAHAVGCRRCGAFTGKSLCQRCANGNIFNFESAYAFGIYNGALRHAIHRLKYGRRRILGKELGRILAASIADSAPFRSERIQSIIPVPLHSSRLRWRGFNQAELLADVLSVDLGYEVLGALKRARKTPSQVHLRRTERAINVSNAFAVTEPNRVAGKSVLLVDDVLTSLATVNECARVLKLAGADKVFVAALARGV